MKKVLSAVAVSVCVFAAGNCLAGNPAKKIDGCPDECQNQIDGLKSGHAQQSEQIRDQAGLIDAQAKEIEALRKTEEHHPWYVQAVVKATWVGDMDITGFADSVETDTGYGGGLALGRQFGNFRVEGELASQKSDLKNVGSGDVRIDTAMINGSYDIPVGPIAIYGTVGMGVGKVDVSVQQVDDSETTFAYKAGVGITYPFHPNMAVSAGYEYLGTNDINISGIEVEDIKSSNFVAAFRYFF